MRPDAQRFFIALSRSLTRWAFSCCPNPYQIHHRIQQSSSTRIDPRYSPEWISVSKILGSPPAFSHVLATLAFAANGLRFPSGIDRWRDSCRGHNQELTIGRCDRWAVGPPCLDLPEPFGELLPSRSSEGRFSSSYRGGARDWLSARSSTRWWVPMNLRRRPQTLAEVGIRSVPDHGF